MKVIQISGWHCKSHSVLICVRVGWDIRQGRVWPFIKHSVLYPGTALVQPGPAFDV